MRIQTLVLGAVLAVTVGACGATSSRSRTTSGSADAAPRPAHDVGHVRGPARLLSPVLVYRVEDPGSSYPTVVAFFRTRDAFSVPHGGPHGIVRPGEILIEDAFDYDHDGFSRLSPGRPRGRCYAWTVAEPPRLHAKRLGDPVEVRLKLKRTTGIQVRTPTLGAMSYQHPTASFRRQLERIGCEFPPAPGPDEAPFVG